MRDLPILRFEIEGVRQQVAFALAESQGALQERVEETLEKTLTEDWVQRQIDQAVRDCVSHAIQEVANNRVLQKLITEAIVAQMTGETDK